MQLVVFTRKTDPFALLAPLAERLRLGVAKRSTCPKVGLQKDRWTRDPTCSALPIQALEPLSCNQGFEDFWIELR